MLERVDGYDSGLRHALAAYLTFEQLRMTAGKPGLIADGARECVVQRLDDMPDDRVRSYIYTAVGERAKEADEEIAEHVSRDKANRRQRPTAWQRR